MATNVSSRKSATTFGDLPDCLSMAPFALAAAPAVIVSLRFPITECDRQWFVTISGPIWILLPSSGEQHTSDEFVVRSLFTPKLGTGEQCCYNESSDVI